MTSGEHIANKQTAEESVMRQLSLFVIAVALVACSNDIQKDPEKVYVVVNNTTGTNNAANNETASNNATDGPTNNGTLNNGTVNNGTPQNNGTVNNGTPTNNGTVNNGTVNNGTTATNNGTTNNGMPPTGDACNNDADLEIVYSTDTPYIARDCYFMCFSEADPRSCSAVCLQNQIGLSEGCSFCVTDLTECGGQHCLAECSDDPYATVCIECLQLHCEEDFIACAGISAY